MMFQTTCRSARVATVLLSQNISNFIAALGAGEKGKAEADSLFANLNTKIFHANSDPITNEWAATTIGKSRQFLINASHSGAAANWLGMTQDYGQTPQASAGLSESIDFDCQPSVFSTLRTGGAENGYLVDAILFQNGRRFKASGRTWMQTVFSQRQTAR
jgi:hypothetical protein